VSVGNDSAPRTIELADGAIVGLGPAGDEASGSVETVDLDGRWVLPGLWDHHVHFQQWAIARDRHDLTDTRSAAQAAVSVRAGLDARDRHTDLIVGVGYRDALWTDQPSAGLLDEHTGTVAAVLISADLHTVWLNTAALSRFGHQPHESGVLREQDAFDVQRALADLPQQRIDQQVADAAVSAAARGVVGIVDFEFFDIGPAWQRRISTGNRSLRVVCSVWPEALADAIGRGHRTGDPLPGTDGLATMGPLKVIIDGSLNTRTAYCRQAYPGRSGAESHGLLTVSPDDLVVLLTTAKRAGLRASVHAIGDNANANALDAYELVGFAATAGCTIEHAQLITAADIARMARLGIVASVQPEHAVDDRDVADRYWSGRTDQAFAYRSLLDAGVALALGSDAPVAPLDPWVAIAAAVHRTRGARPAWHPEQRLSIAEAIAASVHSRIEPGAVADLAIVDQDPFAVDADQLRRLPVAGTMLGGRWTYRAFD
jgi:predicted amidohydrolase YtcJ